MNKNTINENPTVEYPEDAEGFDWSRKFYIDFDVKDDGTLNSVAEKATEYYKAHKSDAERLDLLTQPLPDYYPQTDFYLGAAESTSKYVQEVYQNAVNDAADFAGEKAGELHDLALIEAHLGGVAIDVQQPLTIGEQIEVHKS